MGPAETPNTPQPRPQRREREEAGSPAPGAKGGTRAGSKEEVRNPVGDSGLADAPIGVSLNMRAHKELISQDSHPLGLIPRNSNQGGTQIKREFIGPLNSNKPKKSYTTRALMSSFLLVGGVGD